jgi:hypothetical protein
VTPQENAGINIAESHILLLDPEVQDGAGASSLSTRSFEGLVFNDQ